MANRGELRSTMGSVRNTLHSLYKKTAEAVLPPLSKSQFEEKRVGAL